MASLADQVEEPLPGQPLAARRRDAPRPARFQSLEAARRSRKASTPIDVGEFAAARDAFARAAREDPRHPVAGWRGRAAWRSLTGDRSAAVEAADRAEARLQRRRRRPSALFVEAVVAEARRQDENAARLYDALAAARSRRSGRR